jgi:hypothetical protein
VPLDKTTLQTAIATTFQQGMADPTWSADQTAKALADAIDAYVRGASVVGVTVNVVNPAQVPIGTGAQTGTGTLQ